MCDFETDQSSQQGQYVPALPMVSYGSSFERDVSVTVHPAI